MVVLGGEGMKVELVGSAEKMRYFDYGLHGFTDSLIDDDLYSQLDPVPSSSSVQSV
jgi:hypothetical protein